jgi:hypothetical protein
MGNFPKGHISISPESKIGREHTALVRINSNKDEIVVEFQAKVIIELSAYEKLVKDDFGIFYMSNKPSNDDNEE